MHSIKTFSLPLLYLTATALAGTIAQFEAANYALANQAVAIDAVVCALTPQTPTATAQRIPPALESLTAALNSAIDNAQGIPTITDPAGEARMFESYGLFANNIWELLDELTVQRSNLINVSGLRASTYTQVHKLGVAFLVGSSSKDLVDFTERLVGDAASKHEARYYYGDNTDPIRAVIKSFNLALAAFSP